MAPANEDALYLSSDVRCSIGTHAFKSNNLLYTLVSINLAADSSSEIRALTPNNSSLNAVRRKSPFLTVSTSASGIYFPEMRRSESDRHKRGEMPLYRDAWV